MGNKMKDLRKAIEDVIEDSIVVNVNGSLCDDTGILVDETKFNTLIAEYNIHFVEPEDKQEEYNLQ